MKRIDGVPVIGDNSGILTDGVPVDIGSVAVSGLELKHSAFCKLILLQLDKYSATALGLPV